MKKIKTSKREIVSESDLETLRKAKAILKKKGYEAVLKESGKH